MRRNITVALFLLAAIASLGLSNPATAEEMHVVRDGKLIKEALDWPDVDFEKHPFWKNWGHCGGETVDGLFVVPRKVGARRNHSRFTGSRSALGDCEFKVVLSCTKENSNKWNPNITIHDRGALRFSDDGSRIWMETRKRALPLKTFGAPCDANVYDGALHSMAVRRVGNKISFHYDGKQVNEQEIDPDVNLYMWFDALGSAPKIKSIKLTAEKLSDNLKTAFKSAAPVDLVFDGTGKPQEAVSRQAANKYHVPRIEGRGYAPGKAAVYRIPALVVTKKGTILAFAEARASKFDWGHIRLVVRRSEDSGKTWGPEIDTTRGKFPDHKNGNPVPIVDRETGRIFLINHRCPAGMVHGGDQKVVIAHSDDDGKTWSAPREIPMAEWLPKGFGWMLTGPGHGIQLTQGKHKGRLIAPCYGEGTGYAVYSDDHGKTWTVGAHSPNGPYNEAVCVELSNGDIMLNMRSPGGRGGRRPNRGTAVLTDGGAKYKERTSRFIPELPCPSCQGGTVRYSWPKDGKPGIILFAGPGLPTARARGTLFASYDDGKTWPYKKEIYQGGYGYSDIAVLTNGKIACIFELNKQDLLFTVFDGPPATPPAKAGE